MPDSDEMLFKDEPAEPTHAAAETEGGAAAWKILIVDDETDVHSVTTYMIKGMQYLGRSFQFLHAYSGREAREIVA